MQLNYALKFRFPPFEKGGLGGILRTEDSQPESKSPLFFKGGGFSFNSMELRA